MRLAIFGQRDAGDPVFEIAENLASSFIGILIAATDNDELTWQHSGVNRFAAIFHNIKVVCDKAPEDTPFLWIGNYFIQDDGSGAYGFTKLTKALWEQKKRMAKPRTYQQILSDTANLFPGCRN